MPGGRQKEVRNGQSILIGFLGIDTITKSNKEEEK